MTEAKTETNGARRDCVVFVTHIWTSEVAEHYARLKREAGTVLDVFLAYQHNEGELGTPAPVQADFVVRMADSARHFPLRYQEFLQHPTPWGYVDLVWITAFLDPRLAAYDRFWLVEYDVDFSGDWADFFRPAAGYEGDLLTTRIHPLSAEPSYYFAPIYRQPAHAIADPLIVFMPISRLSRRLLEHYCGMLLQPGWHGHFEMLLPSMARADGFSIAEIGGHDTQTPRERWGHHYDGSHLDMHTMGTTHAYRPPRGFRYFVRAPQQFRQRNRIYHPIKVGLSLRRRLHMRYLPQLKKLRAFSRWLRGKG
ncbi:hypothetical protein LJR016_002766 [Devosia sp. LjRoot16]|uniref:hypothetical protein n=1 Tax=Devosia sp. LjRoot16 TaxID=3342271 RepID=UPI003ED14D04